MVKLGGLSVLSLSLTNTHTHARMHAHASVIKIYLVCLMSLGEKET
jgi:hypothetical protein